MQFSSQQASLVKNSDALSVLIYWELSLVHFQADRISYYMEMAGCMSTDDQGETHSIRCKGKACLIHSHLEARFGSFQFSFYFILLCM